MRVPDPDRRNLLDGRICLVTGGGSGLGRATARLFLKEGARVVLADRNSDGLKAAQAALDDVNVSGMTVDATAEDDVARAMDAVVDRHGALDVLVVNAGMPSSTAPVTELGLDDFDRTLAVHVRGAFLACKHGLRVLSDGGSVVIVSSAAGLRADAGGVARAAADHALVGLMRVVAKEAAGRHIRVNSIHPGPIASEFPAGTDERPTPVPGAVTTVSVDQQTPLGRLARPEEIAKSVLYLVSAQSSFTTGSTLVVDGGMTA
jgi:NAD(P)-dependent dehydrogenase (short-subunit alcohol dehydrogenase family)